MYKKPASITQMLKKSETEYNQFIHTYLQLLTISMQQLAFIPVSEGTCSKAERQVISSLSLIEKMHMHLFARKSLFVDHLVKTEGDETYTDDQEIEFALLEFEKYLKVYHFTKPFYKEQCKNILNQIKKYHFHYSIKVIIENAELPKPWKPKNRKVYIHDVKEVATHEYTNH